MLLQIDERAVNRQLTVAKQAREQCECLCGNARVDERFLTFESLEHAATRRIILGHPVAPLPRSSH